MEQQQFETKKPDPMSVPQYSNLDPRPFGVERKPAVGTADKKTRQELYQAYLQRKERDSKSSGNISFKPSKPWIEPEPVQTKLTIGKAGDKYEQEADEVAENVVKTINAPKATKSEVLQRQETEENKPEVSSVGSESTGSTVSSGFERQLNQAKSGGKSLDSKLQGKMENAMGADFSGVKIHTDTKSDQLNHAIQAKAFTTGKDIFFKQGEYNPSSQDGMKLVAHELTHVQQQSGSQLQRKVIQRDLNPSENDEITSDSQNSQDSNPPMTINGNQEPRKPLPRQPITNNGKKEPTKPLPQITSATLEKLEPPPEELNPKFDMVLGFLWEKMFPKIKRNVAKYNEAIENDDADYDRLSRIINTIIETCQIYTTEYANTQRKAERVEYCKKIIDVAKTERDKVTELQKNHRMNTNDGDLEIGTGRSNLKNEAVKVVGNSTIAASNSTELAKGQSLISLLIAALTGTNKPEGFQAVKENDMSVWEAFSDATQTTAETLTNYTWLSLVRMPLAISEMLVSFGRWRLLKKVKQQLLQRLAGKKEEDYTVTEVEMLDVMNHASGNDNNTFSNWGKLIRQFISKIAKVVRLAIDAIGEIAILVGQAQVTAVTKIASSVLRLTSLAFRKGKGIWKWIQGTRGKHREKSAMTLIREAQNGNEIALNTILVLDPFNDNKKLANATVKLLGRAAGKYQEHEIFLPTLTTRQQIADFLQEIEQDPTKYGFGIAGFTRILADTLKSQ